MHPSSNETAQELHLANEGARVYLDNGLSGHICGYTVYKLHGHAGKHNVYAIVELDEGSAGYMVSKNGQSYISTMLVHVSNLSYKPNPNS